MTFTKFRNYHRREIKRAINEQWIIGLPGPLLPRLEQKNIYISKTFIIFQKVEL